MVQSHPNAFNLLPIEPSRYLFDNCFLQGFEIDLGLIKSARPDYAVRSNSKSFLFIKKVMWERNLYNE